MTINIEIIGKELIIPSAPTPIHRKNFKLSFLDQIQVPFHVPVIFFYQPETNTDTAYYSDSLKQSLSEILKIFYPLGGRLSADGLLVDCNDAGARYVEARVDVELSQVIDDPKIHEFERFLPNDYLHDEVDIGDVIVLGVQLNFFRCGGMAVGVCLHHKLADLFAFLSFMNSWASQSRGETESIENPDFVWGYNTFPPTDSPEILPHLPPATAAVIQETTVTKRLVFDKTKISKLKEEMTTASITPTRVEAVSAFIWKQLMMNKLIEKTTLYVAGHSVNLRPRIKPPLEGLVFGNVIMDALTSPVPVSIRDYTLLVRELRESFRKVSGERCYMDSYVKNLKAEFCKESPGSGERNVETLMFSSWTRFPYYEVDYGWGKPIWVATPRLLMKNLVVLMSTRGGDGIEAWITLAEDDAAELEADAVRKIV